MKTIMNELFTQELKTPTKEMDNKIEVDKPEEETSNDTDWTIEEIETPKTTKFVTEKSIYVNNP